MYKNSNLSEVNSSCYISYVFKFTYPILKSVGIFNHLIRFLQRIILKFFRHNILEIINMLIATTWYHLLNVIVLSINKK